MLFLFRLHCLSGSGNSQQAGKAHICKMLREKPLWKCPHHPILLKLLLLPKIEYNPTSSLQFTSLKYHSRQWNPAAAKVLQEFLEISGSWIGPVNPMFSQSVTAPSHISGRALGVSWHVTGTRSPWISASSTGHSLRALSCSLYGLMVLTPLFL